MVWVRWLIKAGILCMHGCLCATCGVVSCTCMTISYCSMYLYIYNAGQGWPQGTEMLFIGLYTGCPRKNAALLKEYNSLMGLSL